MSVLLETSLGDIVIDLDTKRAPKASLNFLKLCKRKAYNYSLFHTLIKNFTATVGGDCTGDRDSGSSVWGLLDSSDSSDPTVKTNKFFEPERSTKLKHDSKGVVSFVCAQGRVGEEEKLLATSQFFFTLSESGAEYLNTQHAPFGRVVEGLEVLDALNAQLVDDDNRPFRDIRIKHTIILDDPFPDPPGLRCPSRSPSPPPQLLASARIAEDENLFPDVDPEVLEKEARDREAAARALTLEMIGDLPFAEIRPPENILFVCKLNPITRDEDLELIFSRFGEIRSCEIIRDKKTQDSLCYAFIDFEKKESAEEAYFKMDNVLIDDRRIHVDFSQSVSKLHADVLMGKRRGLVEEEEFGGAGLRRRRQYRNEDVGRDGGGRRGEEMVFEHDGDLDREKKRVRRDEKGGDDRRDRDRDAGRGRVDERRRDDRREYRHDDRRGERSDDRGDGKRDGSRRDDRVESGRRDDRDRDYRRDDRDGRRDERHRDGDRRDDRRR
ncbi:cyclophilin-like protein [Rhizoclosmatium globosum]|uniref:Peptidyl-prolyl cis-trans isomerase n=1 Tax=Rhizoclosmatium globosum TaxID=329046 RepID=A0A1Y2BYM0_9FUNG|nr:cyclophilin-like protein [Rhizoclosmatium globosum]|eukprot:ORY39873.1 cyclophilin-like protein [Rhizoclosmatium globosum]